MTHNDIEGIMSVAKVRLQVDLDLTEFSVDVLVGILGIVAAVGGLLSGWTSEILGRRWSLLMAAMFEIIGTICMALAESYTVLAVGRVQHCFIYISRRQPPERGDPDGVRHVPLCNRGSGLMPPSASPLVSWW